MYWADFKCCGDIFGKCPARLFCQARESRRKPRIRVRTGPRRGRLPKHLKDVRDEAAKVKAGAEASGKS